MGTLFAYGHRLRVLLVIVLEDVMPEDGDAAVGRTAKEICRSPKVPSSSRK
jgi:hypothetical protein